jgi:hypothetical protein
MDNKPYIRHAIHNSFSNWDCLIIGKGNKGTSACKIFEIEGQHSLSQNGISYWISGNDRYCGMTIFKNTKEAIKLKSMIDKKVGLTKIENYLIELTFKKLSPNKILAFMKSMNDIYYQEGYNAAKEEIRNVLGIKQY